MSKKAESLVWDRSRAKGSNLLMLVRIADVCGGDDGRYAWPSLDFLARETRLSARGAAHVLHHLERTGEVVIELNTDGHTCESRGRTFQPPWFIHIRCVYDWEAYQQTDGKTAKFASSPFKRGRRKVRLDIAKIADSRTPANRKDCGANRKIQSNNAQNHVAHIRKDPSVDPSVEVQAGAPPLLPPEAPDENVGVITKLAHETLELWPRLEDADLAEAVKSRCARLHIAYDSGTVRKAVDSARWQRAHRAPVGA